MTNRSTILIVDDEPNNVDYLQQELEGLGYATAIATNGAEALAAVKARPPDLILLDVMMPVMDGFTTCRRLKSSEETRFIPVIIMTALDAMQDRIKGIEAGADDFLTKPVNERQLLARIEASLRLKHAMDKKLGTLSRTSDLFSKFVPSAVKHLAEQNPDQSDFQKQERDVSILFLDISGYTRLSEMLPPSTLNQIVERYFSSFLDQVVDGGGDVNETVGDGFLAVFQRADGIQHAIQAVDTALGLLEVTERLNAEGNEHPIAVHLGIASGIALVGATRFEGRHGARWVFTASSREVNVAARLAGIADAGQILISPQTARRVAQTHMVASEGHRKLKNIAEELEIFRVVRRI
ncbi:MAG TPA: response regulator [Stellaceae bacterium]|nr:response regulator [Stellaceae bacterium]